MSAYAPPYASGTTFASFVVPTAEVRYVTQRVGGETGVYTMSPQEVESRVSELASDVAVLRSRVDGLVATADLHQTAGEIKDLIKGVSDSVLRLDGRSMGDVPIAVEPC